MRTKIGPSSVKLWLSAFDTESWADRPGSRWPCSQLSGRRVFAEFDSNGLVDLSIDGKTRDVDSSELNAITSDYLRDVLPENHVAWFVAVGQFNR